MLPYAVLFILCILFVLSIISASSCTNYDDNFSSGLGVIILGTVVSACLFVIGVNWLEEVNAAKRHSAAQETLSGPLDKPSIADEASIVSGTGDVVTVTLLVNPACDEHSHSLDCVYAQRTERDLAEQAGKNAKIILVKEDGIRLGVSAKSLPRLVVSTDDLGTMVTIDHFWLVPGKAAYFLAERFRYIGMMRKAVADGDTAKHDHLRDQNQRLALAGQ
jgi:hypothetical protein